MWKRGDRRSVGQGEGKNIQFLQKVGNNLITYLYSFYGRVDGEV